MRYPGAGWISFLSFFLSPSLCSVWCLTLERQLLQSKEEGAWRKEREEWPPFGTRTGRPASTLSHDGRTSQDWFVSWVPQGWGWDQGAHGVMGEGCCFSTDKSDSISDSHRRPECPSHQAGRAAQIRHYPLVEVAGRP